MATYEGGCQCGAVRYALSVTRIIAYVCHCVECQRQSASAFAISVPVPADALDLIGQLAIYRRPSDSGTHTRCHYCSHCGVRIFHRSERAPAIITLKGGTLDDTSVIVPVAHLWTKRRQPWVILPVGVTSFETQPADLKAWRHALVASCRLDRPDGRQG